MDIGEIINCELAYSKCFCEYYEDENLIRFQDDLLKDMYDHHYTYIKKEMSGEWLACCIKEEINKSLAKGRNYCKIMMESQPDSSCFSRIGDSPEVSRYGYYVFDIHKLDEMQDIESCRVLRICNDEMLGELLQLDRASDEARLGLDFCTRRVKRRGRVYLAEGGVDSYICYNEGVPAGSCDLFIHEGVAKIEDFTVSPCYQRKGYGTVILKALISQALLKGVHRIYLITDEDDTAKEMYLKRGFMKQGEKTELFYRLR